MFFVCILLLFFFEAAKSVARPCGLPVAIFAFFAPIFALRLCTRTLTHLDLSL